MLLFFFSFGILGINFVFMRQAAKRPWKVSPSTKYRPNVSIIVPTYNESCSIRQKLCNLTRLTYLRNLIQIVIVDSNSDDGTIQIIKDFVKNNSAFDFIIIAEEERKGKSAALNLALQHCTGEVIIVSDSDSFWPSDILEKTLPFLADPTVGAVSGPKVLLNAKQSWVTRTEELYLKALNLRRLGESKLGSTLFFEGGFSAFKRSIISAFDQYNTGSDDNGTAIQIIERNLRAIYLPEAEFFTFFPATWREKFNIKTRRANQVVRVCSKYASLLLKRRIKISKGIVWQDVLLNLLSPFLFVLLLLASVPLVLMFPYLLLVLLIFLLPKIGLVISEVIQGQFILFFAIISTAFGKKFAVWNIPEREQVFREELLRSNKLI
jgi:cellulose synthase/poly-beta-1,6-N-acetylglucosamine synthase-like glycosyltransferase